MIKNLQIELGTAVSKHGERNGKKAGAIIVISPPGSRLEINLEFTYRSEL